MTVHLRAEQRAVPPQNCPGVSLPGASSRGLGDAVLWYHWCTSPAPVSCLRLAIARTFLFRRYGWQT